MIGTSTVILPRHGMSIIDIDRLEDKLYRHNSRLTGAADGCGLGFVVLSADAVQIGAVAGYTWAGMAEIKQLWIDETHRGLGLGRRLVETAVAEAIVRDCKCVWVMSHGFQAPGLYQKCGFHRVAELADWPPGYSHVILRRWLQDDQSGQRLGPGG